MITALAITGGSLIAAFTVTTLIFLVGMAIADTGYVGKHR